MVESLDKVSIIIPVYNTQKEYLKECIESIVLQTYKNIEIFLIDDGSCVEIAEYLNTFQERYNIVRVVHKRNEGVAIARNTGLEMASGDWIMFVDSDDIIPRESVEKLMKKNTSDIILGKTCFQWYDSRKIGDNEFDSLIKETDVNKLKRMLIRNILLCKCESSSTTAIWSKIYSKKFLVENHIKFEKDLSLGEDAIFNLNAYSAAKDITFIDNVVYEYRINQDSVTQKYSPKISKDVDNLVMVLDEKIKDSIVREYQSEYNAFIINQINYACIKAIFHSNSTLNHNEKMEWLKNIVNEKKYYDSIRNVDLRLVSSRKKALVMLLRSRAFGFIPLIYKVRMK